MNAEKLIFNDKDFHGLIGRVNKKEIDEKDFLEELDKYKLDIKAFRYLLMNRKDISDDLWKKISLLVVEQGNINTEDLVSLNSEISAMIKR